MNRLPLVMAGVLAAVTAINSCNNQSDNQSVTEQITAAPDVNAEVNSDPKLGAQDVISGAHAIIIEHDVMVPMRDGVKLAADIYFPDVPGHFPVLLVRTPYDKKNNQYGGVDNARYYAENGYAVVVMDSRGLYASEGQWHPYVDEGRDGYDSQQWIGEQSWCNGKIGMYGTSYPGFVQLLSAPYRSPYVKALLPNGAQSDNFRAIWSTDGLFHLATALIWGPSQEAISTGQNLPPLNWMRVMNHLPLQSAMEQIGIHSQFVAATISHDTYDDFWRQMSVRHLYDQMDVPALHMTGWYDELTAETLVNFTRMRESSRSEHARKWQRLVIGPWGHGWRSDPNYGDINFGDEMALDFRSLHLRWFDYHLKGMSNGIVEDAPIRLFVMGDNVWRDEYEWPLARTRSKKLFLHSDGSANSRFGDGILASGPPEAEPPDRYLYDPRHAVPTYGGHGCCGFGLTPDGPLDQRPTQQRQDVLVYSTDLLVEDTEVTGAAEVQLFFTTDVVDTDFFATLSDVYPDGRAIAITEGAVRTRFRDSLEDPSLLNPGEQYEVRIRLWETSNVFKEGHRIRLHISSSSFPRFNRNLNSGKRLGEEGEADLKVATQTIFHDRQRPSVLILPVIPQANLDNH